MNASRAALIVVGVNLVAVWAAAAAGGRVETPGPVASPQAAAEEAVVEARASLLEASVRLEAHARRADVQPALIRDPFHFGAGARSAARNALAAAIVDPAPQGDVEPANGAPAAEPEPDITLQGMAESGEGDAVVRTAILRAGGELVLASIGTRVGGRFEVVALTSESVEMEDLVARVRRTWSLK